MEEELHISRVTIRNYRNFERLSAILAKGVNTVLGENGSGKSNLFRAMRLLLDENMVRAAFRLDESDFHRGLSDWRGHWIVISLEFDELEPDEPIQALFAHGAAEVEFEPVDRAAYSLVFRPKRDVRARLAAVPPGDATALEGARSDISISDYETVFMGRGEADFADDAIYRDLVGDFEAVQFPGEDSPTVGVRVPSILSLTNEVAFTFVPALRNVVEDFHNNRTNPLYALLREKSGEIDPTAFETITSQVADLNEAIEALEDVQEVRSDILLTIRETAGESYSPTSMSIQSGLPDEADRLFQALKLFVGESDEAYEGSISELSLGGANLIYLTLKLLEFRYQRRKESFANFLFVEEPEAHIHTHIQKTLFDRINYQNTQVVYSTHSPQISEVSNVERMIILAREGVACSGFQPSIGLTTSQIQSIQRFLDSVRSNLLFAKSVILVEGDAEEILVPELVRRCLGITLDELGISLVNVRSTGFENLTVLFHHDRIRKRCAVLTDVDEPPTSTEPQESDSPQVIAVKVSRARAFKLGQSRKSRLTELAGESPWLKPFFADHTFEIELIRSGNSNLFVATLGDFYSSPERIESATADLQSDTLAVYGDRVLRLAAKVGKGWLAITAARRLTGDETIPPYILQAIAFARPDLARGVWIQIVQYRLDRAFAAGRLNSEEAVSVREALEAYGEGTKTLTELQADLLQQMPSEGLLDLMTLYA